MSQLETSTTATVNQMINAKDIGFIVDEVNEVAGIDMQDISAPPKLSGDYTNSYAHIMSDESNTKQDCAVFEREDI